MTRSSQRATVEATRHAKRIVFVGMEETGVRCLRALLDLRAHVVGVFTLDEETRQGTVAPRSFTEFAQDGLHLHVTPNINAPDTVRAMRELRPDLIYQVSWSQLLKPEVLRIPRDGCVGMHCSLLPKHRGRAPIPWSIILGLRRSGMTLFYLTEEADRGDIIGQESYAIEPHDSAAEVYEKAAQAAERLIQQYHPLLEQDEAPRLPLDVQRSDVWPGRKPQDGLIDWDMAAMRLYDWVRALSHPFPGAFTFWSDQKLLVWRATPADVPTVAKAGQIIEIVRDRGILVSAGEAGLWLQSIQPEGEPERAAADVAIGYGLAVGETLG